MFVRTGRASAALLACALTVACGQPPTKEMDLARQALEAARTAGAERYAAAELTAAQDALDKSIAAVANRDFKLALNHALDSHERAQAATRSAATAHAALRTRLDGALADATSRLASARTAVSAAARARASRRRAARAGTSLDTIDRDLQKARALLSADDLDAADTILSRVRARIVEVMVSLQPPGKPAAGRRPGTGAAAPTS